MDELKECPITWEQANKAAATLLDIMEDGVAYQQKALNVAFKALYWIANNFRADPENKPLSLQELRQMDGKPVWVEHFDSPCSIKEPGEWLILKSCNPTREHPYVDFKDKALCALYYGQGWFAYVHKQEQEG